MQDIRPISDLRNKFTEISRDVHETGRPVFLTKNGYGNMVVMSKEAYDNLSFELEVAYQLRQATLEAKQDPYRYSYEDMEAMMRKASKGKQYV